MGRIDKEPARTFRLRPGREPFTIVVEYPTEESLSEQQRKQRITALASARGLFQRNSLLFARLRGGLIDDKDQAQMEVGVEARTVAGELLDAGVSVEDVIANVQASLVAQAGRSDTTPLSDIARVYGGFLQENVDRIQAESPTPTL